MKKNIGRIALALAALLAAPAYTQTSFVVQATADRVSLRSRPWPTAEVLAQAAEGERLQGRSEQGEWIGVSAPSAARSASNCGPVGLTLFEKENGSAI